MTALEATNLIPMILDRQTATAPPAQRRVRINVATSTKGVKTWDATVELVDNGTLSQQDLMGEVLAESDRLVALLDLRYPAPEA